MVVRKTDIDRKKGSEEDKDNREKGREIDRQTVSEKDRDRQRDV